jgi:hypothetical protein
MTVHAPVVAGQDDGEDLRTLFQNERSITRERNENTGMREWLTTTEGNGK